MQKRSMILWTVVTLMTIGLTVQAKPDKANKSEKAKAAMEKSEKADEAMSKKAKEKSPGGSSGNDPRFTEGKPPTPAASFLGSSLFFPVVMT